AAVAIARMVAAGPGGEEAGRQAELRLGVIAVVVRHEVARERAAGLAALEVEEPAHRAGPGVDGVEAALAGRDVVHVHAEVDGVGDDRRRRLDLVALAVESAQAGRLAGEGVAAAGAGGEVPALLPGRRVERVELLAGADEDDVLALDRRDGRRRGARERGARLEIGLERPDGEAVL